MYFIELSSSFGDFIGNTPILSIIYEIMVVMYRHPNAIFVLRRHLLLVVPSTAADSNFNIFKRHKNNFGPIKSSN